MVSPTKNPPAIGASAASYSAVPRDGMPSPDLNPPSPNPDPYSSLSGQNLPGSQYLSPEQAETSRLFGNRDSTHIAPSILSRDSTRESILPPGTPEEAGSRASWSSGAELAGAAGGMAGSDFAAGRRPNAARGQSNLAHSTVGWNNTSTDRLSTSDEDDGQGHIAPAGAAGMSEKPAWASDGGYQPKRSRKWLWAGVALGALLIVGLGVGLGVGLTVGKKNSSTSNGSSPGKDGSGSNKPSGTGTASGSTPTAAPISGGQNSLITFEDGSTMNYDNPFGGMWVWDPSDPFNDGAQAQSWTPPLNQSWKWGIDKVYGVNLGGWLNTEPFIVPALYEKYAIGSGGQTAIDEYTLSQNMGDNLTSAMTEHYDTFITERDFAEIASAGLNWIRLPIAHWAIETSSEEPYLERVSWTYVLKTIQWARKYGIRINLDLHTVPGSQNGWNHSGRLGSINWMNGVMGQANAQRALDYIRTLAQFIAQPEYANVIQMFSFINEPNAGSIGQSAVGSFYHEAYNIIRDITGIGEGKGPILPFHDGFIGVTQWYNFLPGADRLALDQHSYMIFGDQPQGTLSEIAHQPCSWWAKGTNDTSKQFGINIAGEWSAASNDCGKWINSVGSGSRYDGTLEGYNGPKPGSCDYYDDYTKWNQSTKDDLLHFVLASMDSLQNYFFWTWKIGNSTGDITEVNPFWHYRLGLQEGWMPKDPRAAVGICAGDGVDGNEFDGTYAQPWMTGGTGAGTIAADQAASYPWPAASFTNVGSGDMVSLPQYTATGTPITMPAATYTKPGSSETISAGSGWANVNADSRQAFVPISGCNYPPEYSAADLPLPASACGAGSSQPTRRSAMPVAFPEPTPAARPQ